MAGLTFTFHGPDGQTVGAVDGRVVVRVDHWYLRYTLEDAAGRSWPVTPTGPWWLGGGGITDAGSVFWAMKRGMGLRWPHTGDTPPVPELPDPDPGVVYAPPS